MTGRMIWVVDDGGRAASGFKGSAGDCVARAIAIVARLPYAEVYKALADGTGSQRASKRANRRPATARSGITVSRKWFGDYMRSLGFVWTATMQIGSGCRVHLVPGELPAGRLVVSLSRHYTAVVDGVIHDTFDPQRHTVETGTRDGVPYRTEFDRCVYGYWRLA